jgi:hypothetical protein
VFDPTARQKVHRRTGERFAFATQHSVLSGTQPRARAANLPRTGTAFFPAAPENTCACSRTNDSQGQAASRRRQLANFLHPSTILLISSLGNRSKMCLSLSCISTIPSVISALAACRKQITIPFRLAEETRFKFQTLYR